MVHSSATVGPGLARPADTAVRMVKTGKDCSQQMPCQLVLVSLKLKPQCADQKHRHLLTSNRFAKPAVPAGAASAYSNRVQCTPCHLCHLFVAPPSLTTLRSPWWTSWPSKRVGQGCVQANPAQLLCCVSISPTPSVTLSTCSDCIVLHPDKLHK